MTRRINCLLTSVALVLAVVCVLISSPIVWSHDAGADVGSVTHAGTSRRTHTCQPIARSVASLPVPLVTFEVPYVPGRCDPMHLLPKQAWRMFACVRWREGGDMPDQPNGAGMYQFTNRDTWNEFRGGFPEVPSDATALEQDVVAYRAWKTEQFLPWNGDPCLGTVRQFGRWGWY